MRPVYEHRACSRGSVLFFGIAFIGGMLLLPELFGISKNEETDEPKSDEETEK